MNPTMTNVIRTERAIRTIQQRLFTMDPARQARATAAIHTLKARMVLYWAARDTATHWMYAAE